MLIHTLLESIATLFAFLIGGIALVRYYAHKSIPYLLLGTAFLGAGISDGFHAVVTSPTCAGCDPPYLLGVAAWSAYISDLFLSLLMCGRLLGWDDDRSAVTLARRRQRSWYMAFGVLTLATFTLLQFAPLPLLHYPGFPIYRAGEMLAGVFYAIAALGHWRKGAWKQVGFEHWLMLYLIVTTVAQLLYVPWSREYFDSINCMSHVLEIAADVFLLVGLLSSMVSMFRGAERALHDQERVSESLAREVATRQKAGAQLEDARRKLERRVAESTAELAEQDELANLGANIAVALTQSDHVEETLQRSAEIICRSLDATLVRIWTLNKEQNVLELKASAGMHAGLKGYERVPVGSFRVGRIAKEAKPYWTNTIQEDAVVGDQEWMRRVGMVALAGQPLMLEDRVEGVVLACAVKPLKDAARQALGSVAGSLGLFIGRRRAQASQVESEERVRLLLDSTAEAIFGVDRDGNCTFANRGGLHKLGYETEEQILGRNMHALTHHTRVDGTPYPPEECPLLRSILAGQVSHIDNEVLWRADGTPVPAEYWGYPVIKGGKILGAVVTFLDISARKHAEDEQRKLVSLVESTDDFIVIASPEQKVLYLNNGAVRMIGLDSAEQAIGAHISTLHPAAAWAQLESTIAIQVRDGQYKCETQVRNWKTGEPIDVLLNAFTLRKPDTGEVVCLAAIMRDITERKRTEEALRNSEERFRIAVENACDLTFDLDLRTGITQVFGEQPRLGGRPAPQTFDAWKSMVHPDDLPALLQAIQRHTQSGERYVGEYRVLGEAGIVYHYSLRAQVICDAAGQPVRWVGLVNDITEQKKTAQAIAQLAAIVQSSDDAIVGISLAGTIM
ncbi:MAG TPA: PAS domain S-box protein, partial [Bryobacteraceae bacterium]|nr:PAS domain S-box protein [Bryobacteraceae bacterium]